MVSVVLVTYNRASFLKFAIEDILAQNFQNFELIICDDASPDETESLCRHYQKIDSRITYIRHPKNLGMPNNLNEGLKLAQYPYVAVLHDGDRFPLNLLERWYKAISDNPNVAFVFNPLLTFDSNCNKHYGSNLFDEGVVEGKLLLRKYYFRNFRFPSAVWGEAMIRKNLIEKYGYLKLAYGFYADVDLWMTLLQENDAYYCEEHLIHCPTKDLQPHQFDDRMMKVFFLLIKMHFSQRLKAFKNTKLRLAYEMVYFLGQSIAGYVYIVLSLIKNYNLKSYLDAGKITVNNNLFYFPLWVIFFPLKCIFPNGFKK